MLKSTGYHWGLAAICEVYPDARIVMTHRDPLKLIASHCSLVSMACSMGSDEVDRIEIGQMWSRSWEEAMRRGVAFRERGHPVARGAFDMHFAEILKDQVDMAQRIYEHFDIPMSEEALRRMRSFIASNPRDRHGTHRYTLEQFGLAAAEIRGRFARYAERFGVEVESAAS